MLAITPRKLFDNQRKKIKKQMIEKGILYNMMTDPVHSARICHIFTPISIFLQNFSMKKLFNTPTV